MTGPDPGGRRYTEEAVAQLRDEVNGLRAQLADQRGEMKKLTDRLDAVEGHGVRIPPGPLVVGS